MNPIREAELLHSLKPCPFCGACNDEGKTPFIFDRSQGGNWTWVMCIQCEACGPPHRAQDTAAHDWNMRPREKTLLAALIALADHSIEGLCFTHCRANGIPNHSPACEQARAAVKMEASGG